MQSRAKIDSLRRIDDPAERVSGLEGGVLRTQMQSPAQGVEFPPVVGRRGDRARRLRRRFAPIPYLLPVFVVYGVFVVYPTCFAFYLSFTRWDGLSPVKRFVGLSNYRLIFAHDPIFWSALRNTLIWTLLAVGVACTVGLGLALLLNEKMPARPLFRAIIYVPGVLSTLVVSMTWSWAYNPFFGAINHSLQTLGLGSLTRPWLGDDSTALLAVFVASTWQTLGLSVILFLAGLQGIREDLVEAARIDGAGTMGVIRYVIVPGLRPTFVVVGSLAVIGAMKAFDMVYAMTYGGPNNSTQLLATWAYFQAFTYHQFGVGSAIAMVLLVLTLLVVIPYVYWSGRDEE